MRGSMSMRKYVSASRVLGHVNNVLGIRPSAAGIRQNSDDGSEQSSASSLDSDSNDDQYSVVEEEDILAEYDEVDVTKDLDSSDDEGNPKRRVRVKQTAPAEPLPTTIGIEIDFLLAVATSGQGNDPHPTDGRNLAQVLRDIDHEDARFHVTVRNGIVDALKNNGLTAVKCVEPNILLHPSSYANEFGWMDSLEAPDSNSATLDQWVGRYQYVDGRGLERNTSDATSSLLGQFVEFHNQQGLLVHQTRLELIDSIADNKVSGWLDFPNYDENDLADRMENEIWRTRVTAEFRVSVRAYIKEARRVLLEEEQRQADPNAVRLPESSAFYDAWTCGVNRGVNPNTIHPSRYIIPEGWQHMKNPQNEDVLPPHVYKWFSGVLRSPTLNYHHPETFPSLQKACAALRNNFRIHLPTPYVPARVKIQFGGDPKWDLLSLKKFITLWVLMEDSLEHLHRYDRSHIGDWPRLRNGPVRKESIQATVLKTSLIGRGPPSGFESAKDEMNSYFPTQEQAPIEDYLRDFIHSIWSHTLHELTDIYLRESCLDMLQFQSLQGTLDAKHIEYWALICDRIISFARNSTAEQFHSALLNMITKKTSPFEILSIPEHVIQFFVSRGASNVSYFQYKDGDRVNWGQPFMVRGSGDTHG
ncbi:hypothetical protein M426DRAFT_17630 [Hypoxylon sp. CI-4A]|nr:hypothetical protein M426DRAFT_17630 [Hypoxylon sp. CI-4A]